MIFFSEPYLVVLLPKPNRDHFITLTTSYKVTTVTIRVVLGVTGNRPYSAVTVYDYVLVHLPERTSLGHFLGKICRSCRGTTTPSTLPNMVESPRQNSMMKNRTDHRGETGIFVMASVNTIKARPVPSTPWKISTQSAATLQHKD